MDIDYYKNILRLRLITERKQSETITANGDDPQNVEGTDIDSDPRVTLRTEIDPKTKKIIYRIVRPNGRSAAEQTAHLKKNKDKKVAIPGARGNVGALEYIDSNGDIMTYPAASQADGISGIPILRSGEDLTGVDPEQMKKNYSPDPEYLKYSAIIKKAFYDKFIPKSPVQSPEMSPKPSWVTKREQQEKDNDTFQIRGINDKGLQPPEKFIINQAISNATDKFIPKSPVQSPEMSPKPSWVTRDETQKQLDALPRRFADGVASIVKSIPDSEDMKRQTAQHIDRYTRRPEDSPKMTAARDAYRATTDKIASEMDSNGRTALSDQADRDDFERMLKASQKP